MNQLAFLDGLYYSKPPSETSNFLISGCDCSIHKVFFEQIIIQSKKNGQKIIVIDDSDNAIVELSTVHSYGFSIKNGLTSNCCIYKLFPLNIKTRWMQLRQILGVLEYTEEQKAKLHSYLDFVTYCEQISRGNNSGDISLRDLGEYSSNIQVGMKIQQMERKGVIDSFQKDYLLSKYLEVCSAGADFEHRLLLLEPMINGQVLTQSQSEIVTYPVSEFDGDSTVKKIAISLLISFLRGHQNENYTVIIFDKGYGERGSLTQFTNNFPSSIDAHLFSKDIFTLSSGNELGMIFNRFTTRIYTRHLSESSCEAVEKECGEMDVVKASYSVTYDRRWRANRPIDVLMGNNKQEVYSTGTPIREPRYRKEDIAKFQPGTGIAKYMGQHILFSL